MLKCHPPWLIQWEVTISGISTLLLWLWSFPLHLLLELLLRLPVLSLLRLPLLLLGWRKHWWWRRRRWWWWWLLQPASIHGRLTRACRACEATLKQLLVWRPYSEGSVNRQRPWG